MHLPSANQYLKIVEEKIPGGLARLHIHQFILNENGKPLCKKGNYAIVFKTEHDSKYYAVRFFLDSEPEVFERYKQIQSYLAARPLHWKVPFEFLDKEVYADEEYYPVVKMNWIESISFTQYLDSIIHDPSLIDQLQQQLIELSRNLEANGIAHGNLNLKHIRFVKHGNGSVLKLIDYDSLFIPSFEGKDSVSAGTAGFQHPMRLASDFSGTIDRFSFWIFLTALEAFKMDPLLWSNAKQNGFDKEEQILFTYRDLAFPEQSVSFQLLRRYHSDALKFYSEKLIAFCNSTSLNDIEAPTLFQGNNSLISDRSENFIYQPETKNSIEEIELIPAGVEEEQPVYSERSVRRKKKNDRGTIYLERTSPEEEWHVPSAKNRRRPVGIIITIAVLLVSVAAYFVWANQIKKSEEKIAVSDKPILKAQPEVPKPKTVFTSANVTQFLFQLYQSYNRRDLPSILSNYADSLGQYYNEDSVTKDQLTGIINNLFIKPAYYECDPDLRTLQFTPNGNICNLTIAVAETIQADKRSKKENYASKIAYTVDTAFKIVSEKNIE